jgi:hypothetical protein
MKKRTRGRTKLCPVVVKIKGRFYVTLTTRKRTMLRLLSFCENGKGGKTRFITTTPISLVGEIGEKDFESYIKSAENHWPVYKPMKFSKYEEAEEALAEKLRIDHDDVTFHSFGLF